MMTKLDFDNFVKATRIYDIYDSFDFLSDFHMLVFVSYDRFFILHLCIGLLLTYIQIDSNYTRDDDVSR